VRREGGEGYMGEGREGFVGEGGMKPTYKRTEADT